jgi:hypothetical protein
MTSNLFGGSVGRGLSEVKRTRGRGAHRGRSLGFGSGVGSLHPVKVWSFEILLRLLVMGV